MHRHVISVILLLSLILAKIFLKEDKNNPKQSSARYLDTSKKIPLAMF